MSGFVWAPAPPAFLGDLHGLLSRQLALILAYGLQTNAIVELRVLTGPGGDEWRLLVNGRPSALGRPYFELLECLATAARADLWRYVKTRQLVAHLRARLPYGAPASVDVHRMIHTLRNRLGYSLETSQHHSEGYRLSTPNIILPGGACTLSSGTSEPAAPLLGLLRRQLGLLLASGARTNTIVELPSRDGGGADKWRLLVNGRPTSLGRPDYELLDRLALEARVDPRSHVTTSQLASHLEERLPCRAPGPAGIHHLIHRLRRRHLGQALQSAEGRGEGYRLSTPNIIRQEDQDDR